MSSWDSHLLEILQKIYHNQNENSSDIIIDQKTEFNNWLMMWFNEEWKNTNNKRMCCQFHYNNMRSLYSLLLYKYDREFILNILKCVSCALNNYNPKMMTTLKQCETLLHHLEQDFRISNSNDLVRINEKYPDIQRSAKFFETVGRATFNYYNRQQYPIIMNTIFMYPFKEYFNCNNKNNNTFFERELFNLLKLIISNENDKWLELLHGKIININKAINIHKNFIKNQKNNIIKKDINKIESIINDFLNYLANIWECSLYSTIHNIDYEMVNCSIKYPNCLLFKRLKCSDLTKSYFGNYEYCLYNLINNVDYGNRCKYILNEFLPNIRKKFLNFKREEEEEEEEEEGKGKGGEEEDGDGGGGGGGGGKEEKETKDDVEDEEDDEEDEDDDDDEEEDESIDADTEIIKKKEY